jgi:hypothetical protein
MNFRRGLFRLWLVASVVFVLAVGTLSFEEIKSQFDAVARLKDLDRYETMLPVLCGQVRGEAGKDYTTKENQVPGPWDTYAKPNPFDACWYTMTAFRPLYTEYKDLSDHELARRLYTAAGTPLTDVPNPWVTLSFWAGIALGIPLAVLALGTALVWALAGFVASRPAGP